MLYNHLKIAWRVFSKRKLYGIINLLGLSVAMAFCLLVSLYVKDEFSYDKFHEKGDRLYLLYDISFKSDDLQVEPGLLDVKPNPLVRKSISQTIPFANLIEERIPEIEMLIRTEGNGTEIAKDGKLISESVRYADKDFFMAFSFNFLYGSPETALEDLDDIVITDEVAMKYFGRTDVYGENIQFGGADGPVRTIAGVIEKPKNSSISLNIVFRYEHSYPYRKAREDWGYAAVAPFVLLKEGADPEAISKKIEAIYKERFAENIENHRTRLGLSADNPVLTYGLKKVEDLYLDPTVRFGKSSSKLYSYILLSVAAIMIVIACINYTAISISLSSARSSEVALRKVMGSSRKQLISQFYTESFLMGIAAVIGGYSLMQLTLPVFSELTDKTYDLTITDQLSAVGIGLAITLFLSLVSGAYPARFMSGLKIVQGIKSQTTHKIKPVLIRGMVVFQFTLCIFFMGLGLGMHKQFKYISNMDLGFDKDQVVYLTGAWGVTDKIKQELDKEPSIISSVGAGGIFGSGRSMGRLTSLGVDYTTLRVHTDYDFFKTMGIELVSGRFFDPTRNRELEQKKTIVNETYYKLLKQDTLMKSRLDNIIGVVKDFHFESLNQQIGPMEFGLSETQFISVMYAKLNGQNLEEGIAAMERAWDAVVPNRTMDLKFLDEYLASNYKDSQRWGRIVDVSAILAVLIACSGLFGLTAINAMNRTKEIGIRKVLGANFSSIVILLNKQNIWLILISMAIALPLWYYFVNQWVEGFAYHTSIGFDLFALAGMLCFLIVVITVSFHSLRTSRINPTTLLRTE
ncbi:MAG: FtsX-like permease family protein [Roseivirga sp.]|nr:FtsX-like permease family protein [Roseivirga sp.]